jgi:hypothetical protein
VLKTSLQQVKVPQRNKAPEKRRTSVLQASKEAKARKEKEAVITKKEYSRAAREIESFLADGFTLTRHVYENALSDGARYFARSIEWT